MYGTELAMFSTASAVSTLVNWCFNLYPYGLMLNAEMPLYELGLTVYTNVQPPN